MQYIVESLETKKNIHKHDFKFYSAFQVYRTNILFTSQRPHTHRHYHKLCVNLLHCQQKAFLHFCIYQKHCSMKMKFYRSIHDKAYSVSSIIHTLLVGDIVYSQLTHGSLILYYANNFIILVSFLAYTTSYILSRLYSYRPGLDFMYLLENVYVTFVTGWIRPC